MYDVYAVDPMFRNSATYDQNRGSELQRRHLAHDSLQNNTNRPLNLFFLNMTAAGKPGIVCIQEWWGVAPWTRAQAQYIADRGFRVLVPDLYRGKLSLEAKEAEHLMGGLDWAGAVEDIRGAVAHLKEEGSKAVGVTGFCMGGALTLASAVLVEGIAAAAPFYGTPSPGLADVSKCSVPVLAQFGEKDNHAGFSDPEAAKALEGKLKASGCEHEVVQVPGVGHGFLNDLFKDGLEANEKLGRPTDPSAARTAFDRAMEFFAKKLV